MQVVYARQPFPTKTTKSIFLAGPTPRKTPNRPPVPSWRPEALEILERLGFDGDVYVPEDAEGEWLMNYDEQVEWEEEGLNRADCVVFWVPRELVDMPAFTTNDEWGAWKHSGKVVFGAPPHTPKVGYQQYYAQKLNVPSQESLKEVLKIAVGRLGDGALRVGGECQVPLYIWRTASFQQWYKAMQNAGNRLEGARVEWTFRLGENREKVFLWALHVDVFVASENRHKKNEVVISRPDIATVVAYYPGPTLLDTEVVLVKEFRSPVLNSDGFVYELPGGSTWKSDMPWREVALHEWNDEVGLIIDDPDRFKEASSRQMLATLSAHHAHLYLLRLRSDELSELYLMRGIPRGVEEDTEKTYVEVKTVRQIMESQFVDYSMVGMIFEALYLQFEQIE